jgi:hypothetical protein
MGDRLRQLFGIRTIDDPVFGRLSFKRDREDVNESRWEGEVVFAPTGSKIELRIYGDEGGPGDGQRELFRMIEARWSELRALCGAELTSFHSEALEEEPPADLWSVYTLARVTVPRRESEDMLWRLGFDSTQDANHVYTVEFQGWSPTGELRPEG